VFLGDTSAIEFAARYAGAQDVATRLGLPPIIALPTHLSPDRASEEIAGHLAAHAGQIDGIFAATDTLAALCLAELRRHGADAAEAVRLVGFDDLPIARQTVPALTTVRQDIAAGARGLVELLLRRLAGETTESLVLPPELVIRETA
jgi:DNA-binding LacI/PurR family transcriptional regulator